MTFRQVATHAGTFAIAAVGLYLWLMVSWLVGALTGAGDDAWLLVTILMVLVALVRAS